ncbi:301_t:CDS:2 [Dentiscutata erythropus]|uniref:301_t:CDS:1 n=1 Tax=Dentiscutata erythropus TaxID=1348616 RepID=A0A9N9FX90_9GLOM|nr:301_t:CDS:2 [Dentiscutata erythropus]
MSEKENPKKKTLLITPFSIATKGSNKRQTVDSSSEGYSSYELETSDILHDNNNPHNLKVPRLAKESLRKDPKAQTDIRDSFIIQAGIDKQRIIQNMQNVYFLIKHNLAIRVYEDLCKLVKIQCNSNQDEFSIGVPYLLK